MKLAGAVLCLLALRAFGSSTPVERVVGLLETLKENLRLDQNAEQKIYDKYACWCEKTTKRKADDIVQAKEDLEALSQQILKLKGKIATLESEIQELTAKIEANEKTQADLTAVRQKENGEWQASTAEMKDALAALEKAIIVLRNATSPGTLPAALVQGKSQTGASAVKDVLLSLPAKSNYPVDRMSLLSEFAKGHTSYAPQSATIQGILTDMYDTFAADLQSAATDEAKANREYENVWATLDAENKVLRKIRAEKEEEKAEAEELLAGTQQTYDDTEKQMKADIVFFDETKAACSAKHDEWVVRVSLRQEEIAGIEEALQILTTDSARELFARSIKPGKETGADTSYDYARSVSPAPVLLQVANDVSSSAPVAKAYTAIKDQAARAHSIRLAAIAVKIRMAKAGHFDAVLKAIDTMLQTLRDEDAADIAKRDQCLLEYKEINKTASDLAWKIKNNIAEIAKLDKLIKKREGELAATIQQIADTKEYMRTITEERKEENMEFLKAKKDDQDAIALLESARDAMSKYYRNNSIELGPIQGEVKGLQLLQRPLTVGAYGPVLDVSADQAPDATFSHMGHRKGQAKDIVSILTYIIEDLKDEIRNGMKDEEATQIAYQKEMDSAQKLLDELEATKTNLKTQIAKLEGDRDAEEADMIQNEADLKAQKDYKKAITPDCDWIIGAFEERAQKRTLEMEGLTKAKEYLVGANFPAAALLEKQRSFNDRLLPSLGFQALSS